MRTGPRFKTLLGTLVALLPSGCSNTHRERAAPLGSKARGPVSVYVTNYPVKYFAERIGGESVEVHFPVPGDTDPAFWMPTAQTIGQYQQADVILLNGAGYEKWVQVASLPKSKLCDTSAAFASEYLVVADAVTHSNGPAGEHAHGGTAFTTWLDPKLAVQQADAVRASLAALRPEQADALQRNFEALRSDLEVLDRELADALSQASDRPLVFSHPVYQYLIRRYELNAQSVHWEPEEPPSEALWRELKQLLAQHPARWMVWESAPLDATVKKLAELGLQSVVFEPCGNAPAQGHYLTVQRQNVKNLRSVFAQPD
jgi:zinc transport system substrate-binding protein